MTTKKHKLQQVLEHTGVAEVRLYSGRGMHGTGCLGVDTDDVGEVFAAILEYLEGEEDTRDVQEAFEYMRIDSMGQGTIMYFPRIPYSDEDEDEAAD